ncbi:MAG: YeeE/YedE family protein [Pseudomonadales bacterium]|nr:YeeE/YedE family protein [Pseudomonadales bacterium]NIX09925.1 YeeE/YedE family protein [Pseudomonadales bacterium]
MIGPFAALLAGTVFGLGLSISGMADPTVVLSFLILGSGWNASLLVVMAAAVAVTTMGYRLAGSRAAPLLDSEFHAPTRRDIDGRLILGAIVFGIGWGLAGYCPGPAIVGALTLDPRALAFLPGFVVGMFAFEALPKPSARQTGQA